jgi:hypothetical protein
MVAAGQQLKKKLQVQLFAEQFVNQAHGPSTQQLAAMFIAQASAEWNAFSAHQRRSARRSGFLAAKQRKSLAPSTKLSA